VQVTVATTAASDAPNEDFFAVTPSAVVLLDGAGIPAGVESGCVHGVAWFVRRLGTQLVELLAVESHQSLTDALGQAIREVAAMHGDTCDPEHAGSPSATVVMLREHPDTVDYLVLADSSIVLELTTQEDLMVVTDDREAHVAKTHRRALHAQATGSVLQKQRLAELATELQHYRNRAGGFWVASANPEAAKHALTGTVPRADLCRAALMSDGATRIADRFHLLTWRDALDLMERQGPGELLRAVRDAEWRDPEGQRWPRGKLHDDATAILCHFTDGSDAPKPL
jgi:Protein phosphatase 2C